MQDTISPEALSSGGQIHYTEGMKPLLLPAAAKGHGAQLLEDKDFRKKLLDWLSRQDENAAR